MKEAVFVHESDRLHHLEHDVANLGLRERPTSLAKPANENPTEEGEGGTYDCAKSSVWCGKRGTQKREQVQERGVRCSKKSAET